MSPRTTSWIRRLTRSSPVYGVIFLFKWLASTTKSSEPDDGTFDQDAAENMFFAQQTIMNACGTQALLSVLLNMPDIEIGPDLQEFKEFTGSFPADVSFKHYHGQLMPTEQSSFEASACRIQSS